MDGVIAGRKILIGYRGIPAPITFKRLRKPFIRLTADIFERFKLSNFRICFMNFNELLCKIYIYAYDFNTYGILNIQVLEKFFSVYSLLCQKYSIS